MYVYPVIQTYHTGVSVIYGTYSSEKKAKDCIRHVLDCAQLGGWEVTPEWYKPHLYGDDNKSIVSRIAKGAAHNVELFHYEKHGVQ